MATSQLLKFQGDEAQPSTFPQMSNFQALFIEVLKKMIVSVESYKIHCYKAPQFLHIFRLYRSKYPIKVDIWALQKISIAHFNREL